MIRLILHELRQGSKHVALKRIGEALTALEKGPPTEWPADEDVAALCAEAPTAAIKGLQRANVVSIASLATLLRLRLRCVKNDQCWYEEDREWRRDGTLFVTHVIFKKELWERTPLQFFEEHPRYAYTASMVLANLSQIYLAEQIENKALCFLVYEMLLDRVALLLSYPHPDAIDVGEYGEEAGRASSAFLWDMHHLTTGIDQMRAVSAPPPDPKWATLLEQTTASRAEWLVGMVIVAAGDDLPEFYKVYYLERAASAAERAIYSRSHVGVSAAAYDVLKEFRGAAAANEIAVHADSFISELIRLDDDGFTADEYDEELRRVLGARIAALDTSEADMLLRCCLSYSVERLVGLDFDKDVVNSHQTHCEMLAELPWHGGWVVAGATFETLSAAFAVFLFPIMRAGGTAFHPETNVVLHWDKVARPCVGI